LTARGFAVVRAVKDVARAPLLAGTDAPNGGTAFGASLHRELELLVAAGLSPIEALRAATSAPAAAFGLRDRGRLAHGLRADVVVVEGDPTTEIRETRSIRAIYKRGVRIDRWALRSRPTPQ
jgi:imidazolonepropionase-like amidohydrolase